MARFGFGKLRPVAEPATVGEMHDVTDALFKRVPVQQNADFIPALGQSPKGPDNWKPGLGEILDRVLGLGITDAMDDARARHDSAPLKAQAAALRQKVLTDPRELMAYLANPGKWGESVSGNYAPHQVAGGSTLKRPGYEDYTAPKLEMSGDSAVSITPDGMKVLGQRPQSQAEETNEAFKQAQILMQQMLARSMISHRENQDSTADYRAHKAPAARSGGAFVPKPTGRIY